ncbi:uncharacterized protein WCC33_002953 [Rhinophrynus dorsalis]
MRVLSLLKDNNLFCKLEKCEFHKTQVIFVAYVISASGFAMDPKKLSAVVQWPHPEGLKVIQRFLGFANYYPKFIRNFSTTVKQITDMTWKGAKVLEWSSNALSAFDNLKAAFTAALILVHPHPALPFTLEVDASEIGVGALLSQQSAPGEDLLLSQCP